MAKYLTEEEVDIVTRAFGNAVEALTGTKRGQVLEFSVRCLVSLGEAEFGGPGGPKESGVFFQVHAFGGGFAGPEALLAMKPAFEELESRRIVDVDTETH